MWRMDCRGKGRNRETNLEPNIFVLVGGDDGHFYCSGNDQGRRKFRIAGEGTDRDMLSLDT